MAQPFLRVDLSTEASDFQNTVIEAGWPFLDKSNANAQILRKWLGAKVAEPDRNGNEVLYYLRTESGARIDQPNVLKTSDKELAGPLRSQFQGIVQALKSAKPETHSEQKLHEKALNELQALAGEKRTADRRCSFFKYRDEKKQWQLVWAPGYRRRDEKPANPAVCTNPTCSFLFLQRADSNTKCPRCQKTPVPRDMGGGKSTLPWLLVMLLLLAVLAGGGWWYWNQNPQASDTTNPAEPILAITPESATITQDGQIEFQAVFKDAEGNESDVTDQLSAMVEDVNIARYSPFDHRVEARAVGKTKVLFYYQKGDKTYPKIVALTVEPRRNPERLKIVPGKLELGVGTTAQLKLMGEYEDGREEDLTAAADWNWEDPEQTGPVFVYRGAIEGKSRGSVQLKARYRASAESDYVESAPAEITVQDLKYQKLELALAKSTFAMGEDPGLSVRVVPEDGEPLSVMGSALLRLKVEPEDLAEIKKESPYLYPLKPGNGTLTATFRGLTETIDFEVTGDGAAPNIAFEANPSKVDLVIGELADVEVPESAKNEPTDYASSDSDVVEVTDSNRLLGKGPGSATVTITRGDQTATVAVNVTDSVYKSLAFDPANVTVRTDETIKLRLLASLANGAQIEINPRHSRLEWVRFPTDGSLDVDREGISVTGLEPTGSEQKTLAVKLGQLSAAAKVRVVGRNLTLALEPNGSIDLPEGQTQPLKVVAEYGNGERVEIAADRVVWNTVPVDGLELKNGEVIAEKSGSGPLTVSATYQGQTSNEVEVRSIESAPVRLALVAEPNSLAVGKSGRVVLRGTTPGGQPVSLSEQGVQYQSDNPDVIEVDPNSGGFRAIGTGTATLSAKHPSYNKTVTTQIEVTNQAPSIQRPDGLRFVTQQTQPIPLPVGVGFIDFAVMAQIDGQDVDVTEECQFTVQGDPANAAVAVRNGVIYGVRPGPAILKAEAGGMTTENELQFNVVPDLNIDEIAITPDRVTLATSENLRLTAEGFLQGRSVGLLGNIAALEWKSRGGDVLRVEGDLVSALKPGSGGVTAQVGNVISNVAEITVAGQANGAIDQLWALPQDITLQPGESIAFGDDIKVYRGASADRPSSGDLSSEAVVAPANPQIATYDPVTKLLQGRLPGQTRVTVAVGQQTTELLVTVLPNAVNTANGRVVVEPGNGVIAVGEQLPLSVYLITENGERLNMTANAVLTSSNTGTIAVAGSGVRGVAEGVANITARLPGVTETGTATFAVKTLEFTRLEVTPPAMTLAPGQIQRFEIRAVGPDGRRILGADPNLKIMQIRDGNATDLPVGLRQYRAGLPGSETLRVEWNGLSQDVPIEVVRANANDLVIRPSDATIEVGETLDYQVFLVRGGRLQPLSNQDGVTLTVDDPSIASLRTTFRVRGEAVGVTRVVATMGTRQASARLQVGPRTRAVLPAGRPLGLRFVPQAIRTELGRPAQSIRVVQYFSDGSTREVASRSNITIDPAGVVDLSNTATSTTITPKALGQTELTATFDGMTTDQPLLINVGERTNTRPVVVVAPSVIRLGVGDVAEPSTVGVRVGNSTEIVPRPYRITAANNNVFTVENGRFIRGTAIGEGTATVTIDDPESSFDGLSGTVLVEVTDTATIIDRTLITRGGTGPGTTTTGTTRVTDDLELELVGPTQITEGSTAGYRVNLVAGTTARNITNQAEFVLSQGEQRLADLAAGGRLIAKAPGVVHLRARYQGMLSNELTIAINPVARDFRRLVLELDDDPMTVGESRNYRLWGYPTNGDPRQDITRLITTGTPGNRPVVSLAAVNPSDDIVNHSSPNLTAVKPGQFTISASLGALTSNAETLTIINAEGTPVDLRVSPSFLTARVGETTEPLSVQVRMNGETRYRSIAPSLVNFESQNTDIAKPGTNAGEFVAGQAGETDIRVSYSGLEATATIQVVTDPFAKIELGKLTADIDTFTVPITITTDSAQGPFEYRLALPGQTLPADAGWKEAATRAGSQSVRLTSPAFRLAGKSRFRVIIEARKAGDDSNRSLVRYPYAFDLDTNTSSNSP